MKIVQRKSAIPETRIFVTRDLKAPYFEPHWHFHPEYQLFLVLEGKGTRFIGDTIQPFKEQDLVLMGPNLPHLWRSDPEYFANNSLLQTQGVVIYLRADFWGTQNPQTDELKDISHLLQNSHRGLEITGETNAVVSQMMLELLTLSGTDSLIQLLKILNIMAHSTDIHAITHTGYVNLHTESEKDRMSRVYEHIIKNFTQRVSLEEVAAIANMSASAFSRYFKSRVNKSFSDFLSELRIGHACKLLNEADMSISQVCYESGFNTLSNFNRQFRDLTGKTPLQYKKECLISQQPIE